MEFPSNLRYTQEHEWIKQEGEFAFVGITDFAQSELGDIVYIDISSQGKIIEKDAVFGTIEAVKTVSDLFLPVKATIIEVNPILENTPELVNSSPHEKGWIVKIKPQNSEDIQKLMSSEDYRKHIGK